MSTAENGAIVERDLEAIDEALERGSALHADVETRALQELALLLSADAYEPDASFGALLGERVEAGFPARAGTPQARLATARARAARSAEGLRRVRVSPRRLLPAAAFVGMLAAAVGVLASVDLGPSSVDDADSGGGGASESSVRPERPADSATRALSRRSGALAAQGGGTTEAVIEPPGGGGGFAPGRRERRIERSASLELAAPVDEIATLADRVTAVTSRHGGFVLSSSVSSGEDDDAAGGDFDLRIPAARLRPALRDLSGLATVRSQSQSGRDATPQHIRAEDRLAAARAERRGLLRRLERAATDTEAEALRRRLEIVAIEIRRLRATLRSLNLRANYAAVSVTLMSAEDDSGTDSNGAAIGDAFEDAGKLLTGAAGVLIRVLALALPLGLLALLGWLAGAGIRRHRRESALA